MLSLQSEESHEITVIASCTVSETWRVTGRKRGFYRPHRSSPKIWQSYPSNFRTVLGSQASLREGLPY